MGKWLPVLAGAASVLLPTASGWAADEAAPTWRATYDLVMMWVNFGILAFCIVKYARAPLMDLLRNEGRKKAEDIEQAEASRKEMEAKVRETMSALDSSRERLKRVTERIVTEGELKRQALIESAQVESRLMLERTRTKITLHITEAREELKLQLIDQAVEQALERLPSEVNDEDRAHMVERFLARI
jgi:F-type H+-transporting ATPase subunit b